MATNLAEPRDIKKIILHGGDNFHIPLERVHQMIALEDSELIEFSTHDSPEDSFRVIKGN
jgi:quercetin dioxygenase-like cupin family protein